MFDKGQILKKAFELIEFFFLSDCQTGQIITENSFAPQNMPQSAKLSFLGVLKYFRRKLTKNFY